MSRCFPFPPPGYEKKPRSDHEDLLIKEKHKEKKHRKEKDKEKRESKERKDKDRSKDKHREKKDKKDKHRDKDKKKHKDKNKDKKKISSQRKGEEHTEGQNEKNPGEGSFKPENLSDPKFAEELGRRIRDEENGACNQMGGKTTDRVQRTCENMGNSAEKERTTGNKMVQSFTTPDHGMVMARGMEKKGTGSVCEEQRVNGVGRPMAQDADKKIEGMERTKEQETHHRKGDGHKDRLEEKMHREKSKKGDKEKEKEKEKTREKIEHKHKEKDQLRNVNRKELVDSQTSFTPKDNKKSASLDGSLKRKQINGFCHENEIRCNKKLKPSFSSILPLENGRKLDQCHIGSPCASGSLEAVNLGKVEGHKENKSNGKIDIRPPSTISGSPFTSKAAENGVSLKRSPHPDEKYLSQILHLPKMEELPEFDDQDWLFSRDGIRQKPKMPRDADESLQVWATALQTEMSDVLALPYVIPY